MTEQYRNEPIPSREMNREKSSFHDHALDLTYGRSTEDIRNQRGSTIYFLTLKDAQNMIPEIDGTSRTNVPQFLNASLFAIKSIHPAEEHSLLQAIL